jgi:hypothetical protein
MRIHRIPHTWWDQRMECGQCLWKIGQLDHSMDWSEGKFTPLHQACINYCTLYNIVLCLTEGFGNCKSDRPLSTV